MTDVPGLAGRVSKLGGDVKQLEDDGKQICSLVAFVCEALCEMRPELREGLSDRISSSLQEFDSMGRHERSRTLRYGLELIQARIDV